MKLQSSWVHLVRIAHISQIRTGRQSLPSNLSHPAYLHLTILRLRAEDLRKHPPSRGTLTRINGWNTYCELLWHTLAMRITECHCLIDWVRGAFHTEENWLSRVGVWHASSDRWRTEIRPTQSRPEWNLACCSRTSFSRRDVWRNGNLSNYRNVTQPTRNIAPTACSLLRDHDN